MLVKGRPRTQAKGYPTIKVSGPQGVRLASYQVFSQEVLFVCLHSFAIHQAPGPSGHQPGQMHDQQRGGEENELSEERADEATGDLPNDDVADF
jgi:hypothetical protein